MIDLTTSNMKNTISKLIDRSLRFHHQDIHKELDEIKERQAKIQIRFRNYERYCVFWGIAITSVVAGLMYVGTSYHRMADVVRDIDIVIEVPDIKYLN